MKKIRSEYELFESSADTWTLEPYNDHILGIGRYYHDQKLWHSLISIEDDQTAWINENEDYVNLMTGEPVSKKCPGCLDTVSNGCIISMETCNETGEKPERKSREEISETKPTQ